jgi:hypothetical protein
VRFERARCIPHRIPKIGRGLERGVNFLPNRLGTALFSPNDALAAIEDRREGGRIDPVLIRLTQPTRGFLNRGTVPRERTRLRQLVR